MNDIEKERARGREKYHRLYKGKKRLNEARRKSDLAYRQRFPEKYAAGKAIRNRERKPGIDFHHWSYRPEHYKDIIELPKDHHYKCHRFLIYDQEQLMYRTTDGVLLDSKESHLAYINDKKIVYAQ